MSKSQKKLIPQVEKQKGAFEFDICDYINSPDVAKHLNYYKFSTYEMVCIVGRSKKSEEIRFEGFKWIMENLPDEPLNLSAFRLFYNTLKKCFDYQTKLIELNANPYYDNLKCFEYYKKWNLLFDETLKQKVAFDEMFDKFTNNPIISYTSDITEEEFYSIISLSNSLFGMLNFYMNNYKYFNNYYHHASDLFPLTNLPLPFQPGQIILSYTDYDHYGVNVVTDNTNNNISGYYVCSEYCNIEGPMNFGDVYDFIAIEDKEYDLDYLKTADVLSNCIRKKYKSGNPISMEDIVEVLNKQTKHLLEHHDEVIEDFSKAVLKKAKEQGVVIDWLT